MFKFTFKQLKYPLLASFTIPVYLGYNYLSNNNLQSREFYNNILQDKISKLGEEDISVAEIYEKIAKIERKDDNTEEAIKYIKKAILIHEGFGETSYKYLEILYKDLAECFKHCNKEDEYLISLKESFEWKFKNFKIEDIKYLTEYRDLSFKLETVGLVESAVESMNNLLGIVSALISDELNQASSNTAKLKDIQIDCLIGLGNIIFKKSAPEFDKNGLSRANNYYEEALYINKNRNDQDLEITNQILYHLAKTNYTLQKLDKAINYCKESFNITETIKNSTNIPFFYCNSITGSDFLHLGNIQMAESNLSKSINTYENIQKNEQKNDTEIKDNELQYSKTLTNLGLTFYKKKQPKQSLEYTKKGLEILERLKGDTDRDVLAVKYNLAVALFEAGELREAWDVISDVYLKSKTKFGDGYPLTASALQFINMFTVMPRS